MTRFQSDVVSLIATMVKTFRRNKRYKFVSDRIYRGRAPSASGVFEEEVARLIESHTSSSIKIYIDSPISFRKRPGERATIIYPDISLIRGSKLVGLVECKIDLGYLSDKWAKEYKQKIKALKQSGKFNIHREQISAHKDMLDFGVILSNSNHPENIEHFYNGVGDYCVFLSECRSHPNNNDIQPRKYVEDVGTQEEYREWRKLSGFLRALP